MQRAGPGPAAKQFPTPGYAGYNVAWSPFFPDRLAVAGAANVRSLDRLTQYGLVGNGRLSIFNTMAPGPPKL